jgi:uridine kinase
MPSAKDVFLFEGIQVLYPGVDRILRSAQYKSIHIAPQTSIEIGAEVFEPNEIRLMRRLVRDYHFRNAEPEFTFTIWKSVRDNEEKLIFPNVHLCDYKIDSTMPYEIGILKPYLERILQNVTRDAVHGKQASAVLAELREVQALSADLIPQNSLYKEFI